MPLHVYGYYSKIEEDIQRFYPDFDLANFKCMKSFLEMWVIEKEVEQGSDSKNESFRSSPPSSPNGALESKQTEEPPPPSNQPPCHPSAPKDNTTPLS